LDKHVLFKNSSFVSISFRLIMLSVLTLHTSRSIKLYHRYGHAIFIKKFVTKFGFINLCTLLENCFVNECIVNMLHVNIFIY